MKSRRPSGGDPALSVLLRGLVAFAAIAACLSAPAAVARDVPLVLRQTKAAAGGPALDSLKTIRLTYRLRQSGLEGGGETLIGKPIQVVFIGSCTNGRLSDLQLAAGVLKGHKVASGVRMLVVPGSQQVKREAERLGLDKIFIEAGAQWRESGCSMCIGMNGDTAGRGEYAVSTSNRNFEGRQGAGARTLLASPATAAAAAIAGKIADPRAYLPH